MAFKCEKKADVWDAYAGARCILLKKEKKNEKFIRKLIAMVHINFIAPRDNIAAYLLLCVSALIKYCPRVAKLYIHAFRKRLIGGFFFI